MAKAPAATKKKQRPGTFSSENQPANRTHVGRGPNRLTRDIKEGIVDAAIRHGEDGEGTGGLAGYLFMLAKDFPKQYASLLGRMLPLQIQGNISTYIGAVNITPVPSGKFLTADQMRELNPPETIDGEAVRIEVTDEEEDAA